MTLLGSWQGSGHILGRLLIKLGVIFRIFHLIKFKCNKNEIHKKSKKIIIFSTEVIFCLCQNLPTVESDQDWVWKYFFLLSFNTDFQNVAQFHIQLVSKDNLYFTLRSKHLIGILFWTKKVYYSKQKKIFSRFTSKSIFQCIKKIRENFCLWKHEKNLKSRTL